MKRADQVLVKVNRKNMVLMAAKGTGYERRVARAVMAMDRSLPEADGGPGSGNHGHAGIPGHRGGSAKGSGYSTAKASQAKPAQPAQHSRVPSKRFVPMLARA